MKSLGLIATSTLVPSTIFSFTLRGILPREVITDDPSIIPSINSQLPLSDATCLVSGQKYI